MKGVHTGKGSSRMVLWSARDYKFIRKITTMKRDNQPRETLKNTLNTLTSA